MKRMASWFLILSLVLCTWLASAETAGNNSYVCVEAGTVAYKAPDGGETAGFFTSEAIVYAEELTDHSQEWLMVVFDTRDARNIGWPVFKVYVKKEFVTPLTESEEAQFLAEIANDASARQYNSHSLTSVGFIKAVQTVAEAAESEQTKETPSAAPLAVVSSETVESVSPEVTAQPEKKEAPVILQQPESVIAAKGETVTFSAQVTNADRYIWEFNDGNGWHALPESDAWAGAATPSLSFTLNEVRSHNSYRLKVIGEGGKAISAEVTAQLADHPFFLTQPESGFASANTEVRLFAEVRGAADYQWEFNSGDGWHALKEGNWQGVKTAELTFTQTAARAGNEYRLRVIGKDRSNAYSDTVTVALPPKPLIRVQPKSSKAANGATVTLRAEVDYANSYVWQYHDGEKWRDIVENDNWQGVKTNELTFTQSRRRSENRYRLKAIGESGFTYSTAVRVRLLIIPTDMAVRPETLTLIPGASAKLSVRVKPENAENTGVTYSSSDEQVAQVDKYGVVTAVSEGTAEIAVTAKANPELSFTVTVTVTSENAGN